MSEAAKSPGSPDPAEAPAQPPEASPVRERILVAAIKRFETFGFRRTGMAEIARDVGVVPGTLYHYFKDKEDLFREVVRAENTVWIERARKVLAEPGTAFERLQHLGMASVAFNQEHALVASILNRDAEIVCPHLIDETHEQTLEATVGLMAKVIREGIEAGEFRQMDPDKAALLLFLTGQALFNQTRYDYAAILPLLLGIVQRGMLREP